MIHGRGLIAFSNGGRNLTYLQSEKRFNCKQKQGLPYTQHKLQSAEPARKDASRPGDPTGGGGSEMWQATAWGHGREAEEVRAFVWAAGEAIFPPFLFFSFEDLICFDETSLI
jgi:hypothetical protein